MKAWNSYSTAPSFMDMQKECLNYLLIKSYIYKFPPNSRRPHFEHAGKTLHRFGSTLPRRRRLDTERILNGY